MKTEELSTVQKLVVEIANQSGLICPVCHTQLKPSAPCGLIWECEKCNKVSREPMKLSDQIPAIVEQIEKEAIRHANEDAILKRLDRIIELLEENNRLLNQLDITVGSR